MLELPPHYLKDEGLLRRPGDGFCVAGPGEQIEIRLRGEETGGAWALVEHLLAPGSAGPPLQFNTAEDRLFYVLEGALLFQVGMRRITLAGSAMSYVPRGTMHGFCNPYAAPARLLDLISPAGFERFFEERAASAVPPAGAPSDVSALIALTRKYGGVLVGPPLPVPHPLLALPHE